MFFGAVIGSAGPLVTGMISDALTADLGNQALGRALVVPVMQVAAVALYLVASRNYRREIVDVQAS